MKTELRWPDTAVQVIELWHDGQMVGHIDGADGPGIRVISKHPLIAVERGPDSGPDVIEVRIIE